MTTPQEPTPQEPTPQEPTPQEHCIIVGAGSAGCVLANRLSASGERRVTLLDDGPDLVAGKVPAGIAGSSFFAALAEPGRVHETLMATRAAGIEPSLYQRGRGIGGSSAINAMVALPGSDALYRCWGWTDIDAAWRRVEIPGELAPVNTLGAVDRALLAADSRAARVKLTRRNGKRVTSAEAYLWPVLDRTNLDVRPESGVAAVLFDGRTASGVRLVDGTTIDADRVILAAGAIHSPALLLRSGVDTAGVGRGLQDHPSVVFTLKLADGVSQDRSGLAIASVLHAAIGNDLVQLLPLNHLGPDPDTAGLAALMVALMTPVGRSGTVTIGATGEPIVDFAMLEDRHDLQTLVAGVELALGILQRPAFATILETVYIDAVGTTSEALTSRAAIAHWIRTSCGDYVHATSTCAMGTVVDAEAAVIGYDQLYVCDASIFPTIPDANTHLPTTMLAERFCLRNP